MDSWTHFIINNPLKMKYEYESETNKAHKVHNQTEIENRSKTKNARNKNQSIDDRTQSRSFASGNLDLSQSVLDKRQPRTVPIH